MPSSFFPEREPSADRMPEPVSGGRGERGGTLDRDESSECGTEEPKGQVLGGQGFPGRAERCRENGTEKSSEMY